MESNSDSCSFIVAVALVITGVGGILGAMALGTLWGAGTGGVIGGLFHMASGGSFLDGFWEGAFCGAIGGMISGGMAFAFTGGAAGVALSLGETLKIGAVSGAGISLIGDLGDKFIKGEDISWSQMLINTTFAAGFGAAFSGAFYGLSKGFTALKMKFGKGGSKTNFDNEIPRSGAEWNEYLKGKYGADNVRWNINSVDDIFSNPTRLKGYTVDELQTILGNDWTRGVYGSNGGGWKLMNGDISIFYHPGGGKHGGSYYGISSGATGKIKVVNPETYIPLKGDKATVIYD